jgi:hypothetical protein
MARRFTVESRPETGIVVLNSAGSVSLDLMIFVVATRLGTKQQEPVSSAIGA